MIESLTGITGQSLALALDAANMRQQVAASNIANANAPGYVPFRVRFEEQLATALDARRGASNAANLSAPSLRPSVELAGPTADGSAPTVKIDEEAAGIVQNTIHYQALLRAMRGHLDLLQAAINDGRR